MTDYNVAIRITTDTSGVNDLAQGLNRVNREAEQVGDAARAAADDMTRGLDVAGRSTGRLSDGFNEVRNEAERAGREAEDALRSTDEAARDAERSISAMTNGFAVLAAAGAGALIGGQLLKLGGFAIDAYQQTEKLNETLGDVIDSAEAAATAMSGLRAFAGDVSTHNLEKAVEDFAALKEAGIDPTVEALRSYNNTATALGTDLTSMAEAAVAASKGQFDLIKELGVGVELEADKVRFTMDDTTTEIQNSSESIQQYLLAIGNTQYAGALEDQNKTLQGSLDNLSDSFADVKDSFSELITEFLESSGIADTVKSSLNGIAGYARDAAKSIRSVIGTPDELVSSIMSGDETKVKQQILELNDEFKRASEARRAEIRNEMQDFTEALKDKQSEIANLIMQKTASNNSDGWLEQFSRGGNTDEDAAALGRLAGIQSTVTELYKNMHTAALSASEAAAQAAQGINKLAGELEDTSIPWLPAIERYKKEVSASASQFAIDARLVQAVIMQESIVASQKRGVSPETIGSPAGAQGMMQLMPDTAAEVAKQVGMTGYNLHNAADNIKLGTAYLSKMLYQHNGDIAKALAAYNAGPGAVQKYGGVPPYKETQDYVKKVTEYYRELTGETKKEATKQQQEAAKAAKQQLEIKRIGIDSETKLSLSRLEAESQINSQAKAKSLQELESRLQQERAAEESAYKIKRDGLQKRLALEVDPVAQTKIKAELEQLEQEHQNKLKTIDAKAVNDRAQITEQASKKELELAKARADSAQAIELAKIKAQEQAQASGHAKTIQALEAATAKQQAIEEQAYQAKLRNLQQQLNLTGGQEDSTESIKIKSQIEVLEQEHQAALSAITRKAEEERARLVEQSTKKQTDLSKVQSEQRTALALASLATEEKLQQTQQSKTIKDLEQALEAEKRIETERYQIKLKSLQEQSTLVGGDSLAEKAKVQGQIEALEQQHQDNIKVIAAKGEAERARLAEQAARVQKEVAQAQTNQDKTLALARIDTEERLLQAKKIKTVQQVDEVLEQERQFEDRRYQIKLKAAQDELALASKGNDPVAKVKAQGQLEQLEQQHQDKLSLIAKKAEDERTRLHEQAAKQKLEIDRNNAEQRSALALAEIDAEEQLSRERQQLGLQNAQRTLQLEQQFETRRHQIQLQTLQAKRALEMMNPDKNPVTLNQLNLQIEKLEQQHQIRMNAIRRQGFFQQKQHITGLISASTQSMQQSLAGMLSMTTSLSEGMRGMFAGVLNAGTNMLAELAAKWIQQKLMEMVYGKTSALSQIGANAATAGSGAYAATAAIPVVGPAMAPAAAASAYAGALSFTGLIPSAAGGFDIPAGINPLTQLHEREMVLPAKHADTIRNLEGIQQQPTSQSFNFNITAMNAREVKRLLENEGGALVKSLRGQLRNFNGLSS